MKTAATEAGYISSLMEQMALSHPEVSIKYMANGQLKLHTSGNNQMKDVIYKIYGRDITRQLLPVEWENEFLKISGYLGKPSVSRGNRSFENYFINGRYVKDKIITRGLEDGFHGYMMQHKYPFAVLQIQMTGNGLDVNVHPSKLEVRFSKGEEVYQAVCNAVKETLGKKELIPEVTLKKRERPQKLSSASKPKEPVPEPFEAQRRASFKPVSYGQIAAQSPQPQEIKEQTDYRQKKKTAPESAKPPSGYPDPATPKHADLKLEESKPTALQPQSQKTDPSKKPQETQMELFSQIGRAHV